MNEMEIWSEALTLSGHVRLDDGTLGRVWQNFTIDGRLVTIDRPLIPLGDGLAIGPVLEANGMGIRIDLDRWCAMSVHAADTPVLSVDVPSPEDAVALHQVFAAAPGIDWSASAADMDLWAMSYDPTAPRPAPPDSPGPAAICPADPQRAAVRPARWRRLARVLGLDTVVTLCLLCIPPVLTAMWLDSRPRSWWGLIAVVLVTVVVATVLVSEWRRRRLISQARKQKRRSR